MIEVSIMENKKYLRIFAGVFFLLGFGITAMILAMAFLPMHGSDPSALRSFLVGNWNASLGALLLFLLGIFVLANAFGAAGVMQLMRAGLTAALLAPALLENNALAELGTASRVFVYATDILLVFSALLFAVGLFAKNRTGKGLVITAAILGLLAALGSVISPFVMLDGFAALAQNLSPILRSLVNTLVPALFFFLGQLCLSGYFGAMPDPRPVAWIDRMIEERDRAAAPARSVNF